MFTRYLLRTFALATTCLAPLVASADDFEVEPAPAPAAATESAPAVRLGSVPLQGYIETGVMGVAGSGANHAGRYNGLNTTGADAVGAFDLSGRAPWNSGDTRYYSFTGSDLVYQGGNQPGSGWASGTNNSLGNSAELELRAGDQGTWGLGAYYDAITYTGNVIDSLYTVNGGRAFLNNNLAPWGGATATAPGVTAFTVPQLQATGAMLPFQVGTRRDIVGGDGKYQWADWTFSVAFRHEHKEGSMEESFFADNSAGELGGVAFALPIDYDTDRIDATAAYTTRALQGSLQYTFSHFGDNIGFVNLPYPISNTKAPFQNSAAYSTPPSTDAHYLTLMLASNDIVPKTRINLNARVGLEEQDNSFAPNTGDPNPASLPGYGSLNPATLQGTSANSLNAVATVYQLKASVSSHPLADLDTRVYYGLDARNVSLDQYKVNIGSLGGGGDSSAVGLAFVVPQDWLKQNAGAEVGYRIIPDYDTKLTVGYRFDDVDRSNAQVGHSSTSTASAAVTSEFGPEINGKLSFEYADRTGNLSYLTPWQNLNCPATDCGVAPGQTYSGAYYQAPMTSEAVTVRADYTPTHRLSGGLFLQFKNENYTYPAATPVGNATASTVPITGVGEGVKQDYALSVGPDINFRPNDNTNIHLFYTYELLFYNNAGNGACADAAQASTAACAGTAGYFQNKDTTSTHTVGVSGDWKINDKLRLRGDYTISYGTVMFGQYNGVFVSNPTQSYQNVSNYPDINSLMNSLKVTASYQLAPNIELAAQVGYMSYHDNDWNNTANAIQGAGTSAISFLTPGYGSANYSIVTVMGGIKFTL